MLGGAVEQTADALWMSIQFGAENATPDGAFYGGVGPFTAAFPAII